MKRCPWWCPWAWWTFGNCWYPCRFYHPLYLSAPTNRWRESTQPGLSQQLVLQMQWKHPLLSPPEFFGCARRWPEHLCLFQYPGRRQQWPPCPPAPPASVLHTAVQNNVKLMKHLTETIQMFRMYCTTSYRWACRLISHRNLLHFISLTFTWWNHFSLHLLCLKST